jgi:UDP-N-acetyl-D-mannosaminuronic acid dehydrogenase
MTLSSLRKRIEEKQARLAVIGLGYVGLPVACMFAQKGFNVVGIEIKSERAEMINAGITPIDGDEPGLRELLAEVVANGLLHATNRYQELADRDIILIDVETPVDKSHIPHYDALRSALYQLGPVLQKGALVIVESTIAPGTMQSVVFPLLESTSGYRLNEGFYLGNCPERVMPGKLLKNLCCLSRVVGGGSIQTAETMIALYSQIVQADLDPVDWITAELVKTVENTYRDVQIAFANEIALICEAVNADVWKIRDLVNKSPYRNMHMPGPGVGGHCIPKDPWLLVHGIDDKQVPLRLIPSARAVNDSMPCHMVDLIDKGLSVIGHTLDHARILVLGYAYLENSDDARNSPSEILVNKLHKCGAEVLIHDAIIPDYQSDIYQIAQNCDVVVGMVKHSAYRSIDLQRLKLALHTPVLVDGRRVFDENQATKLGYTYLCLGSSRLDLG